MIAIEGETLIGRGYATRYKRRTSLGSDLASTPEQLMPAYVAGMIYLQASTGIISIAVWCAPVVSSECPPFIPTGEAQNYYLLVDPANPIAVTPKVTPQCIPLPAGIFAAHSIKLVATFAGDRGPTEQVELSFKA